jgi:glycine cleavage system aminomethyltransferase T
MVVTSAICQTRDLAWLRTHIAASRGASCTVTDVTAGSRDARRDGAAQRASCCRRSRAPTCRTPRIPSGIRAKSKSATRPCAPAASPTWANSAGNSTCRRTLPGRVRATAGSGRAAGLAHAGYHAMGACRVEKGYRHWSHDIGDEDTPLEAGLASPSPGTSLAGFWGAMRLLAQRARGTLPKRLVQVALEDSSADAPLLYHEEPIVRNGSIVGSIKSGAWGHRVGRSIGMGYVLRGRRHARMAGVGAVGNRGGRPAPRCGGAAAALVRPEERTHQELSGSLSC